MMERQIVFPAMPPLAHDDRCPRQVRAHGATFEYVSFQCVPQLSRMLGLEADVDVLDAIKTPYGLEMSNVFLLLQEPCHCTDQGLRIAAGSTLRLNLYRHVSGHWILGSVYRTVHMPTGASSIIAPISRIVPTVNVAAACCCCCGVGGGM